jgi:hypothetical protein
VDKKVHEFSAEKFPDNGNRKKEAIGTWLPALRGLIVTTAGNDAMDVWMVGERLPPGMQHGHDADVGAQPLGVGGKLKQGFFDSSEHEIVEAFFIAQGERIEFMRDGKDRVKIADGQQLLKPVIDPGEACGCLTPGAMAVATGMKANNFVTAFIALLNLSAHCWRTARGNGGNDLAVMARKRRN